jgi:hypothetical protein
MFLSRRNGIYHLFYEDATGNHGAEYAWFSDQEQTCPCGANVQRCPYDHANTPGAAARWMQSGLPVERSASVAGQGVTPVESRYRERRALLCPTLSQSAPLCRARHKRHTFASWLVEAGASLYHVTRLMGYASPTTTAIYAYLVPDQLHSVLAPLSLSPCSPAYQDAAPPEPPDGAF